MAADDISEIISAIREDVVNNMISLYIPPRTMVEQWNITGLEEHLRLEFGVEIAVQQMLSEDKRLQEEGLRQKIIAILEDNHREKEKSLGETTIRNVEKTFMLRALDHNWKEHLAAMDYLRQGIHFRGYAQKDPKQEYKREAFEMFTNLLETIKFEVIGLLFKIPIDAGEMRDEYDLKINTAAQIPAHEVEHGGEHLAAIADTEQPTFVEMPTSLSNDNVGRNDPCPCGSGLKYKQCHGKLT
jgi:preprotein translocase subunit SecA